MQDVLQNSSPSGSGRCAAHPTASIYVISRCCVGCAAARRRRRRHLSAGVSTAAALVEAVVWEHSEDAPLGTPARGPLRKTAA